MDKIFINSNGKQIGPFTIQEVQSRVNTGELVPSDLAFYKGLPNWISVRELLSNSSQVLPPILPDTAKSEKKAWAITGMVLGILSCVNCLLILNTPVIFIGFNDFLWLSALGVPGAVFSHLSIKRNMGGRNMRNE